MACDFVVLLPDSPPPSRQQTHVRTTSDVALSILQSVDELEAKFSVYRPDSEVSRINHAAGGRAVSVSPPTLAVIERAIQLAKRTDGAFDITAAPLIELWGIGRSSGGRPTVDQIAAARSLLGSDRIEVDRDRREIRLPAARMKINLGAIGKGFAVDQIAGRLIEMGIDDFLIHAGQSTVRAAGDQEGLSEAAMEQLDEPRRRPIGWKVGLAHPLRSGRRLAGFWLRDAALSTSGSGKQYFHHRGRRYGHVLDPRTGMPAGRWWSLSLICPDATEADAMSTALFVQDPLPQVDGPLLVVGPGGRSGDLRVQSRGQWTWADPPDETIHDREVPP